MTDKRGPHGCPAQLAAIASDLVKKLDGTWNGDHGMCRCPAHDDHHPSLSIRLGDVALLFKCFAGCDRHDILRAIRRIDGDALARRSVPEPSRWQDERADAWLRQRACELWMNTQPLPCTQADAYLRQRGLTTSSPALRYCHVTPFGRGRAVRFRPALIAAVFEGCTLFAVQRTFLEIGKPRRARDLGNPRRMLGRPMGGAVMLAPEGQTLGLAEGVETALSAMTILGIPVWATLGSERMDRITIPARVTHLVLLPDRDRAGGRGAAKALDAYNRPGLTVEVVWPPLGFKDWNDALRMEERGDGVSGDRWIEWSAHHRQENSRHA